MAKYNIGKFKIVSIRGSGNIKFNLITYNDDIVIPLILKR